MKTERNLLIRENGCMGKWVKGLAFFLMKLKNKFKGIDRAGSLSRLCGQAAEYW